MEREREREMERAREREVVGLLLYSCFYVCLAYVPILCLLLQLTWFVFNSWLLHFMAIRGMILKFWSWCNIPVTSETTCLKIFYQIIISSLSIHCSDMFDVTWRSDRKYIPKQPCPQCTDISSRLCMLETSQFRQEQPHHFDFLATQCSSVRQYALKIWRTFYDLSFLDPWIYGYATVSYNQILEHLKFWPAPTAFTTAVLKVNFVLGKRRWTDFCLKH